MHYNMSLFPLSFFLNPPDKTTGHHSTEYVCTSYMVLFCSHLSDHQPSQRTDRLMKSPHPREEEEYQNVNKGKVCSYTI